MQYVFDFDVVWANWPRLEQGVWDTVVLALATLSCGFILGVFGAFWRGSQTRAVAVTVFLVGDVVRNTPLLVQLFLCFFGLSSLGVRLTPFQAAWLTLSLHTAAYVTEIVRAGIQGVPSGQVDAALGLGLRRGRVFRLIVLPQALEAMYPALVSQFILIMLASSLASTISAEELTLAGNEIVSRTFRSFEIYMALTVVYLILVLAFRLGFVLLGLLLFPRRQAIQVMLPWVKRDASLTSVQAST